MSTQEHDELPPDLLERNYKNQLKWWLDSTDKTQRELASLTRYFVFDEERRNPGVTEATFSRTIREIPQQKSRLYNLYAILGVLFALNTISKQEIERFVQTYGIGPPENETWERIWTKLEAGAVGYRETLVTGSDTVQNVQQPSLSKHHFKTRQLRVIVVLLLLGMGGLLFIVLRITAPLAASPCSEPILRTDPVLLREQGVSQYVADESFSGRSMLSNNIRSIGINQRGVWVGYASAAEKIDSVSLYSGETWVHCHGLSLGIGQPINGFAFQDNNVFIATDGGGIATLENNDWHFYRVDQGLPSNSVYNLYIDRQGQLWAATYEGVASFINGVWQTVYTASSEGMASNHVHAVLEDRQRNWWFGFIDRGISRMNSQGNWDSFYNDAPGWQNVRNITTDSDEGVWFATDGGGLLRFYNGAWTEFSAAVDQLPSFRVNDVERDQHGRIWVATDQGVVYTPDHGQIWLIHSTMNTLDIEFGCADCVYDENDLWLVLKDVGLGHVRIPPPNPTIEIVSSPPFVQLRPGQSYIFSVEVQVIRERLTDVEGDSLRSSDPNGTNLYGAYPIIPVRGEIQVGQTYTFSNVDNPIIAPATPGRYELSWRIWQGRRFVTDPIMVEFEVLSE